MYSTARCPQAGRHRADLSHAHTTRPAGSRTRHGAATRASLRRPAGAHHLSAVAASSTQCLNTCVAPRGPQARVVSRRGGSIYAVPPHLHQVASIVSAGASRDCRGAAARVSLRRPTGAHHLSAVAASSTQCLNTCVAPRGPQARVVSRRGGSIYAVPPHLHQVASIVSAGASRDCRGAAARVSLRRPTGAHHLSAVAASSTQCLNTYVAPRGPQARVISPP